MHHKHALLRRAHYFRIHDITADLPRPTAAKQECIRRANVQYIALADRPLLVSVLVIGVLIKRVRWGYGQSGR